MIKYKQIIQILAIALFVTGCATIINGPTQEVSVETIPPGAVVSTGAFEMQTPAKLLLYRDHDYILTISKQGYQTEQVKVVHVISAVTAGNIVSFGVIGMAIDAATGSIWTLEPAHIVVTLRPVHPFELFLIANWLTPDTLESNLEILALYKEKNLLTDDQYKVMRALTIDCVASSLPFYARLKEMNRLA